MAKKQDVGLNPAALRAALEGDLENAIIASTSGGIENQEAQGQAKMLENCMLPKKIGYEHIAQQAYEKMGIKILGDADDIFYEVELPEGWKINPAENAMNSYWSNLIDNKNRIRAEIFYKAAFYDRNAHIHVVKRFKCEVVPEDRWNSDISYEERQKRPWQGVAYDCNEEIFTTKPKVLKSAIENQEAEKEKMRKICENFLDEKYPDWKDDFAYWD